MNRRGLVYVLTELPDAEVVVDVDGILIDVQRVHYLRERDAVVLSLHPDDLADVLRMRMAGSRPFVDPHKTR